MSETIENITSVILVWLVGIPIFAATALWFFCGAIEMITGIEIKDIVSEKLKKKK